LRTAGTFAAAVRMRAGRHEGYERGGAYHERTKGHMMKSSTAPVLYPQRMRRQSMNVLLRACAKFVRDFGFWPKAGELAAAMQVAPYAVQWYMDELARDGCVRRSKMYGESGAWIVTPQGWATLGVVPIAPYMPRPGRSSRKKLVRSVARRVVEKLAQVDKNAESGTIGP